MKRRCLRAARRLLTALGTRGPRLSRQLQHPSLPASRVAAALGVTVPLLSDTQQLREPLAILEIRLDQKTRDPQHKDSGKATCVEPRAATPHTALMPPSLPLMHGHQHPGEMEGRGGPDLAKESLSARFGKEVSAKGMGGGGG